MERTALAMGQKRTSTKIQPAPTKEADALPREAARKQRKERKERRRKERRRLKEAELLWRYSEEGRKEKERRRKAENKSFWQKNRKYQRKVHQMLGVIASDYLAKSEVYEQWRGLLNDMQEYLCLHQVEGEWWHGVRAIHLLDGQHPSLDD